MSALALMLHQMGHKVQGSDVENTISLKEDWNKRASLSYLLARTTLRQIWNLSLGMPFVKTTKKWPML